MSTEWRPSDKEVRHAFLSNAHIQEGEKAGGGATLAEFHDRQPNFPTSHHEHSCIRSSENMGKCVRGQGDSLQAMCIKTIRI